jgi:subtilisin family serine protease
MRSVTLRRLLASSAALTLLACQDATTPTGTAALDVAGSTETPALTTWMVAGVDGQLRSESIDALRALARAEVTVLAPIGVAIIETSVAGFGDAARAVPGVRAVLREPASSAAGGSGEATAAAMVEAPGPLARSAEFAGAVETEPMFDGQWGLRAIDVQRAWDAGARGQGARVFIIDSGIDHDHPDLAPNLNLALSRSFVPGAPVFVPPTNIQHHGTLVAGIIAAAQNGVGVVGVAPEAEIVAVRIIPQVGSFRFADVMQALVYAADNGADVIVMSFGTNFPRHGGQISERAVTVTASEAQEIVRLLSDAVQYAHSRGATLVAAAGNIELDSEEDRDRIVVPADLPHVITVSSTTPSHFAFDRNTDLDLPASYNNTGQSRIDIAAPGGEFGTWNPALQLCTVVTITFPCHVFDGVLTTANGGGFRYGTGTSMAAPHVAGVAALLIGLNGGSMDPDQVESLLLRGADDLGKPGHDGIFGAGRLNAGRSVALVGR